MTRRFVALLAAAMLATALLPQAAAGADPKSTLSKDDRALLARAEATGSETTTVLIAAQRGANKTVANGIAALGGTVQYREDQIDYIRAAVPTDKVEDAAALKGVQSLDVDSVIPLPDPRVGDPAGATDPTPFPAPSAATPRNNPYMPIGDTGAAQFTAAHPTWDGRGVTIGILDSGIDLDHPACRRPPPASARSSTGSPHTDPFTDDDPTWVNMQAQVSGADVHLQRRHLHRAGGGIVPDRPLQRARPAPGRRGRQRRQPRRQPGRQQRHVRRAVGHRRPTTSGSTPTRTTTSPTSRR